MRHPSKIGGLRWPDQPRQDTAQRDPRRWLRPASGRRPPIEVVDDIRMYEEARHG